MRTFKYNAERFSELRKMIIIRSLLVLVPAVAVGLYIGLRGAEPAVLSIAIPVSILGVTMASGFGLLRGIKRQRALYETYRLTVDENAVTREQQNTQTIRLLKSDITLITKNGNGSFTIKGKNPRDVIGIAPQIENYEELELLLRQMRPFSGPVHQPLLERYGRFLALGVLILFAAVFLSTSKTIVTLAGLVLVGLFVWSVIKVQKNKNIDAKTKRSMYLVIFPIFMIIAKIAFLWM
jgi:hypothetical protein